MNDDPFDEPLSCSVVAGNFFLGIAIALMHVGPKLWADEQLTRRSHYDGPHMEGIAYLGAFFFGVPLVGSIIGAFFVAVASVLYKRNIQGWPRFFSALGWISLPICIVINYVQMTS